jgi:hypothetical protein
MKVLKKAGAIPPWTLSNDERSSVEPMYGDPKGKPLSTDTFLIYTGTRFGR